ncbi:MAG TPA: hypothetical protein RMH80_31895, partial [Polyangiaceae bacterium LLY-WYZ-15_(1-7)]|nr:hypothetical protein [Polyangiaceae bacterium LLY-WYZ-15_(1-7)]
HGVEPVLADGADRQVLATVLRGVELLPYDPRRGREIDLGGLAARAGAEGVVSLLVDEGPRVGVLTWIHGGGKSRLALRHRGLLLARTPYEPELVDCLLTVEDDGLIPDADWRAPAIDWEAPEIGEWERRMVTAIVDALRGEETEDVRGLVHAGELDVPPIRRLLLIAISRWEGASRALGEARWKALLERPLIERLGAPPASLLDVTEQRLSVLRPGQVTRAERFEDFQPLIADEALESAIAKILRRRLPDGTEELERRRMEAVREANLARHRRRGARPLPEAGGEVVAVSGAGFSGVVQPQRGLLSSTFSIEVRFEERPLEKLSSAAEMPLAAIVNVDERHLDPTGAGLDPASQKALERAVHRAAGRVLLAIAEDDPAKLVDDSVSASLFDVWLRERAHRRGARKARRKLAEAKIFRTVQGGRASLEEASTKARIRVARFDAEWVGPPEGEDRHHLDRPILQLPEGDAGERLRDALDRFGHPRICLDQTRAVRTLQGERRVRQGLVEEPKLSGIDPRLSASVEELLGDRRRLRGIGPGEVGLTKTAGAASLTVFGASERTAEVELELDLPVRAVMTIPALGADDIDAKRVRYLSRRVRELVQTLLVEKVLPELDALPAWVREVARAALLQELLTPDEVGDAALFETTGDARVSLGRLQAQARRFGALWVATDPGWRAQRLEPLDPKRIALRGDAKTVEALRALGVDAVAADEELALDERARRNQAQGKARSLALPLWTRSRALARTSLEEKEWRAELAVLEPEATDRGGLRFFRELHPLGGESSPGPWPIYAHVDAPGLVPDRTWEGPKPSKLLERIRARLVDAAAEALAELVPEPEGALATFVVHPERAAGAMGAGTAAGVLAVGPLEPGTIDVPQGFHGGVLRPDVQPPEGGPKEPLPVYGTLLACVDTAHAPGLRLQHAARTAYTAMMAELARRLRTGELEGADAELARGHLVRAIGLGAWKPQGKAKKIEVPCFHPEPKTLGEVYALLREETRNVAVRDPADAAGTKHCLVEDGSDAARELVAALGDRVRRKRVEPLVTPEGVEAAGAEQMERFIKGEISLTGLMGRRADASEDAKKGKSKSKS